MKQWVIDQPAFAEKLLEGLNEIDWPESVSYTHLDVYKRQKLLLHFVQSFSATVAVFFAINNSILVFYPYHVYFFWL